MHPPAQPLAQRTERTFQSLTYQSHEPAHEPGSERHAVALIVERGIDVGLAGVGETMVAPRCAPAVAHNETLVGSIADHGRGVATADGVGLERIQLAMGC